MATTKIIEHVLTDEELAVIGRLCIAGYSTDDAVSLTIDRRPDPGHALGCSICESGGSHDAQL
jgi:hypothetical protein